MADTVSSQLKKGVLDLCVLALLDRKDSYAYEIAAQLTQTVDMGEGTIYPLMRRLQQDGYVNTYLQESPTGPPRKYYAITPTGRASLTTQKNEWQQFTDAVNQILGETHE